MMYKLMDKKMWKYNIFNWGLTEGFQKASSFILQFLTANQQQKQPQNFAHVVKHWARAGISDLLMSLSSQDQVLLEK